MRLILTTSPGAIAGADPLDARTSGRRFAHLAFAALTVGGVALVAVLTRLPNLLVIPAFTDEVEEVARGLAILQDGLRPLTNVDPYIGPFWNYLLAGLFWLLGPSMAIPRATVLASGVATVVLTYFLGCSWYGRRVGLLGALLLAVSATHVAVNSHVAWSNCVTPLFTTAALLVLTQSLQRDRPRLLTVAGALFGLALHTHPTALPVLVGAAAAVVVTRRRWLASPWAYLGALLALAMNANLVVYNALTGGHTLRHAQAIRASYEQEVGASAGYAERLADLLVGLARMLGSSLERRASLLDHALDPLIILAVTLALIGLAIAVRRGDRLGPLVLGASVAILPLVNPKYDPILNGRYLAPVLPICLFWIGLALEWLSASNDGAREPCITLRGIVARTSAMTGLVAAALVSTTLVVGSTVALERYYDDVRENGRTGARILELAHTARLAGPSAYPVVLDERLDRMSLGPGAGIVLRVLHLALELEGVPSEVLWLGEQRPSSVRPGQLVVLAARSKPRFTAEAVTALGLQAANGGPARPHSQASRYGLYRFGPTTMGRSATGAARASGGDAARDGKPAQSGDGVSGVAPERGATDR